MVSSRNEANVERAVESLREKGSVEGVVCHAGKEDHRRQLLEKVRTAKFSLSHIYILKHTYSHTDSEEVWRSGYSSFQCSSQSCIWGHH